MMRMLPFICDCALSSEDLVVQDSFSTLVNDFRVFRDFNNSVTLYMDARPFVISDDDPKLALFIETVQKVSRRMLSSWQDINEWKGDVLLRITTIANINKQLCHHEYDNDIFEALSHFYLSIASRGHSCPLADNLLLNTTEGSLLHSLFIRSHFRGRPKLDAHPFEKFAGYVIENGLNAFPESLINCLKENCEFNRGRVFYSSILEQVDRLIRHFLQRSEANHYFPFSRDDRLRSISQLMEFAVSDLGSVWDGQRNTLIGWRNLLRDTLQRLENSRDLSNQACGSDADLSRPERDPWDLQRSMWILDSEQEPWIDELLNLRVLLNKLEESLNDGLQ